MELPAARGGSATCAGACLSVLFSVLQRTDALRPAEALGEVAQGREAQNLGDLGQGVVGLRQQEPALLDAPVN